MGTNSQLTIFLTLFILTLNGEEVTFQFYSLPLMPRLSTCWSPTYGEYLIELLLQKYQIFLCLSIVSSLY